jgi:hypothetical protein
MSYLGDFAEDATVYVYVTTHAQSGAAVAPSTAFEAADFVIYKNGAAAQKTTTNGVTISSPFDTVTGLHLLAIDTSVDTGDAAFWATGADYAVVLSPDETVDSLAVVRVVAQFSIERRAVETGVSDLAALRYLAAVIAGKTSGAGTSSETFKGIGTNTTRAVVTVSAVGERSAVTLS